MKKVLIVEDSSAYQREYAGKLSGKVEIVAAQDLKSAQQAFENEALFDLIVMDACVDSGMPDSIPLVRLIRQSFVGPMIAASSSMEYRTKLVEVGCSHQAAKADVPDLVLQLLEIG